MSSIKYKEYFLKLSDEEKKTAPKELFFEGNFDLMETGIRISIVGSRNASEEGLVRAELITKELLNRNICIVSGLAEGIDTIAHKTAIDNKGKTIAVLGTPLDNCYPSKNKILLQEIKKNHLAVSEFASESKIFQSNFPKRNKTMALISDATIIIEAKESSGTRHQAWEAIRLGRKVFLLENLTKDRTLTWPSKLVDYGAIVLTRNNIDSILTEFCKYNYVEFA